LRRASSEEEIRFRLFRNQDIPCAVTRLLPLAEVSLIPAPQIIVGFVELFGELKADNPNILCDPLDVRTNAIEHAHVVIAPDCEKEMINLVSSSS
jgi:hypothetical protein